MQALNTPFLPCVDNNLGVTAGTKRIPKLPQLLGDFLKVIDFTVIYDNDGPIFAEKRLSSSFKINN
jgi:hypothetical protein